MSVKSGLSIILLCISALLSGSLTAYPNSAVACYMGASDGDYSASVMRLTLFKIKGADWYMDYILFPKSQSSQNIILSENNFLEVGIFDRNFCECAEMASAIRDAYNHMSERNDTIYTPIYIWESLILRDGHLYPDTTDMSMKIAEQNELNRPARKSYYFSVSYGRYDNFNDIMGQGAPPIARFWKYQIFRSPFIITSYRNTDVYSDYLGYCRNSGINPIPANTTGLDRNKYTREEIDCYLRYALESDRQYVAKGVEVLYVQPFTYGGNHDRPAVELSIPLDDLDCEELDSFVREHCDIGQ